VLEAGNVYYYSNYLVGVITHITKLFFLYYNFFFFFRTIINCPKDSDSRENTCYWDFTTTPIYRQPYEYYYFTLIGDNILGNSTTTIRFHHYANGILHILFTFYLTMNTSMFRLDFTLK